MKQRTILILFLLAIMLAALYQWNSLNRMRVRDEFERISIAEGVTIHDLVEAAGSRMIKEGERQLTEFLDTLYQNETIIYIGLFKEDDLLYLLSRYEGFFPVARGQSPDNTRMIETAVGRVFEIKGHFPSKTGEAYRLFIGFDYQFLDNIGEAADRNFMLIAGVFSLLMLSIIGLIIIFERKFYNKELQFIKATQEKERFKELSILTSEIAHEIKNPLNSIYLSFAALESQLENDPDTIFYKNAVKGEIKRITDIINSYSDLSKEIEPAIASVDLQEWTESFRRLVEHECAEKQIRLTIALNGTPTINTDPGILKQVLFNVVRNSMEAEATEISLTFDITDSNLSIMIRDNGKGVDLSIADRLFKPYATTKTKGMGLGLHVTLKQVKALSGSIELITGKPGETTFKLTIPRRGNHAG